MATTTRTEQIFEELYRSYSADVFRFTLYLSGNRALAQDLTAETFVRVWTAAAAIQVSTAKAYLFSIARNLYLDSLRRTRREDGGAAGDLSASAAAAPGSPAAEYEKRAELAQTLADLETIAEGDRAALVMAVFEEMSHEETARALGISVGSVKSRIFRARMRLVELKQRRMTRTNT